MSAISDRALLLARPVAIPSGSMRVPLFGVLWVVVNVALVGLEIYIHYPFACSFLAGLLNGTLLSVIVVSMASERFQAGATGLLGGLSVSGPRNALWTARLAPWAFREARSCTTRSNKKLYTWF
jgi:hypothetical protein